MLKWLMRRAVAAFERQWSYDSSYLHELIGISPARGLDVLACRRDREVPQGCAGSRLDGRGHHFRAARGLRPLHPAGRIDGGEGGRGSKVLRAILEEDSAAMPDDVALAWRFTCATL